MGILTPSALSFIEVIECSTIREYDALIGSGHDQEIKTEARLTVRESQSAISVFFKGRSLTFSSRPLYDRWGNRRYSVSWSLENTAHSAVQSRGLLRQHKQFTDLKMGHAESGDDARFRFRHGPAASFWESISMRVGDPRAFLKEVTGTKRRFETEDIEGPTAAAPLVSGFSDALPVKKSLPDLAFNYDELGQISRTQI